jgi:hypothetical protein
VLPFLGNFISIREITQPNLFAFAENSAAREDNQIHKAFQKLWTFAVRQGNFYKSAHVINSVGSTQAELKKVFLAAFQILLSESTTDPDQNPNSKQLSLEYPYTDVDDKFYDIAPVEKSYVLISR